MERTHRIMFVCHGNICRSPMAEFLLKDMIKKEGLADRFVIASAGTSREEIGNPVHQGTRKKLAQDHISAAGKYAVQLTKEDYEKYDYCNYFGINYQSYQSCHNIPYDGLSVKMIHFP